MTTPGCPVDDQLVAGHQRAVLRMIAAGAEPGAVLTHLVQALEASLPGSRCSVLVLDPATGRLHHGAAPSLPDEYCSLVDGLQIGPSVGSCGTAAYTLQTVVVSDIATDPRWSELRSEALDTGVRACWSAPIVSPDGLALGTFAVYHDTPYTPTPDELGRLGQFSELAGLAMAHARLFRRVSESEELFRSSFEHSAAAMALITTDGTLLTANDAFVALLGLPAGSLPDVCLAELVDPADAASIHDLLERALALGVGRADIECRLRPPTGRAVDAIGTISPVRDANGTVTRLCLSFVDITARQRAVGERIARAMAESARATAESANRSKSEFLNSMSHEMRGPLTAILGYSEMLADAGLTADFRSRAVGAVALASSHLLAIIDDVLDLARIEAGIATVDVEPVHALDVVDEVTRLVAPLAEARGVTLQVHDDGPPVPVAADRRRLRQVLLNVVSNAVKHGRAGGYVDVLVEPGSISVRDDGDGIPDDLRDRLFVPFTRHGRSGDAGGSGLGLAIAHQLMARMGGAIEAANAADGGAVVTVRLASSAETRVAV